jgi:hypothetical protein
MVFREFHVVELKNRAKLLQDMVPTNGTLNAPTHASFPHGLLAILEQNWKTLHKSLPRSILWYAIVLMYHNEISFLCLFNYTTNAPFGKEA